MEGTQSFAIPLPFPSWHEVPMPRGPTSDDDFGTWVGAGLKLSAERTLTVQWQLSASCFALGDY